MQEQYAEQVKYDLETEDEDYYRHTYQEEHRILDMVRLGNVEEAVRLSNEMDFHVPDRKSVV